MSDKEIEEKVNRINELLEEKEITIQDDYFTDIYNDKNNNQIFRVTSSRCFESQEEAENALEETVSNLEKFSYETEIEP